MPSLPLQNSENDSSKLSSPHHIIVDVRDGKQVGSVSYDTPVAASLQITRIKQGG